MKNRTQVFISYSHKDISWLNRLQVHLKSLELDHAVTIWADTAITPGRLWLKEIQQALNKAKIAILLVSADFLASKYIRENELPPLLAAAEKDNAVVIPIILSHCRFFQTPYLSKFQPINDPENPLDGLSLSSQESVFYNVSKAVENALVKQSPQLLIPQSPSPSTQLPSQFPLSGRARIIYTCRSTFNKKPFPCPDEEASVIPFVVSTHMPVDELETFGVLVASYGSSLLEMFEAKSKRSVVCSRWAAKSLLADDDTKSGWKPPCAGKIPPHLLDNLLIIGENNFSNIILPLYCHHLSWRHQVSQTAAFSSAIGVSPPSTPQVKPFFCPEDTNVADAPINYSIDNTNYSWGILTITRNPFAPDKWLIVFLGCQRRGQYLLMHWLRHTTMLAKAAHWMKNSNYNVTSIQFVVKGKSRDPHSGRPQQIWDFELLKNSNGDPFFHRSISKRIFNSKTNAPIADLSILGCFHSNEPWLLMLLETLPDPLRNLIQKDIHITIYEFLHQKGVSKRGLTEAIFNRENGFLDTLTGLFKESPQFNVVIRQTRATKYSLQVFADIYCDIKDIWDYQKRFLTQSPQTPIQATDIVRRNSLIAKSTLSANLQKCFNVCDVPFPLHITLLRFDNAVSKDTVNLAKDWAKKNSNTIWGETRDLELLLARAYTYPFSDVKTCSLNRGDNL